MTNKEFMRALHNRGIRMMDVAESLGMSAPLLTLIVQGRRTPTSWFYRKLLRLYPFFFIGEKGELQAQPSEPRKRPSRGGISLDAKYGRRNTYAETQ